MSIWIAVTPTLVPATLKSISPKASSNPNMSVSIATSSSSLIKPIATPAQGLLTGTPASMSAREAPQTEAIEEEPFDSRMSDTTRMVYGNSSCEGSRGRMARSANAPCPCSRREVPR